MGFEIKSGVKVMGTFDSCPHTFETFVTFEANEYITAEIHPTGALSIFKVDHNAPEFRNTLCILAPGQWVNCVRMK